MQSLKDLRAENAARQLNRTASDVAASELSTPGSGGRGTTAPAAPSTGAPRLARTLAPLAAASAGSLAASRVRSAGDTEGVVAGGQEDNREARRRRRIRRREKEQQQQQQQQQQQEPNDEDDERLSAHRDEVYADALSGASSRAGMAESEQEYAAASDAAEEGATTVAKRGTTVDSGLDGKYVVQDSIRQDELPVNAAVHAKEGSAAGGGNGGGGLSARGAPPQEKPKKKLTPLAARRARIEQQKREEAERKSGLSQQVSREDPSTLPPDNRGGETMGGGQGASLVREGDSKPGSKGDAEKSRGGMFGNRSAARRRNEQQSKQHQEEVSLPDDKGDDGQDTKHDPLTSDGARVGGPVVAGSKKTEKYADDGLLATGNEAESKATGGRGGDARAGGAGGRAAIVEDGNTDESEREGSGTDDGNGEDPPEGRFGGMGDRMKTARKGLMSTKSPTLATFRRGNKAEGGKTVGRGGNSRSRGRENVPAAAQDGRGGSGDAVSGGEGKKDGVPGKASGGRAKDVTAAGAASSEVLQQQGDESDTTSNDSGFSQAPLNEPKDYSTDDSSDTDDSDSGSRGDKAGGKGWRPGRGTTEATTAGGDTQVTLGHVVDRKMREMGYIRKPAVDELKNRRSLRDRVAAEGAPEVHFIGEITGAEGFGSGISCRFRVEGGRHWTCLSGLEEGQTHVINVDYGESFTPWNHPIDLHYTTKSIQGWPRLMVQVWQLDAHGRNILRGYGFRHLPSTAGFSEVSLPCWRPTGTMQEETAAFFLGVTPLLTAEDAVFNRAWDQRCRLVTLPAGTVWIQINGLFRNLQDQDMGTLLPFS